MKTNKITVFDLFEKQRRYLVPIFQRGYVWTRDAQWEPLWQDLLDQAREVREQSAKPKPLVRKHFLGAIVLNQLPTTIKQAAAYEIIDGQQRLMTLQVLLAALRDITKPLGSDYLNITLERLTTNPGPFGDQDERFKVWPTAAYHEDLRSVMKAGSAEAIKEKYPQRFHYRKWVPPRPPLVDAYLFFCEAIITHLRGQADAEEEPQPDAPPNSERAEELAGAILREVQLVAIELEAEDDPQVIFETLNARGVPLEPSDLIRNFLFLYASRHGEDVQTLYEHCWKDFDEAPGGSGKFWKQKERQGRFLRSRLDLFLFHYLTYRVQHEVKMGHVYQEFRDWWNGESEPRSVTEELAALHNSSKSFHALLVPPSDTRLGILAQRLRVLDTTTVYPLILWMCDHRKGLAEEEFEGMLDDIESYLVRRSVCDLTPKNYNRIFLAILSKLCREGPPNRLTLRRELLALKGESSLWPNDEMFKERLVYAPLYQRPGPKMTRVVLTALELGYRTSRQEYQNTPPGASLTVEHIWPQSDTTQDDWPLPAVQEDNPILRGLKRLEIVNRLGNLTLLTQPLNSQISRGPFRLKRPEITKQSLLSLNAYFQNFADGDVWNESTILQRGLQLAERALNVWPYPQSTLVSNPPNVT